MAPAYSGGADGRRRRQVDRQGRRSLHLAVERRKEGEASGLGLWQMEFRALWAL
jgi:hypothetical protein